MYQQAGRPFHGEFSSADASALSEVNSRFALYASNSLAAVTLAANEQVLITDIDVVCGGTALTVTLYDGADTTVSAGEQVLKGTFAANGGISSHLLVPHYCQKGLAFLPIAGGRARQDGWGAGLGFSGAGRGEGWSRAGRPSRSGIVALRSV